MFSFGIRLFDLADLEGIIGLIKILAGAGLTTPPAKKLEIERRGGRRQPARGKQGKGWTARRYYPVILKLCVSWNTMYSVSPPEQVNHDDLFPTDWLF